MGNSPSRNELHGDHMSNIGNNSSGQETFQSHSYPAKFSSVPGIHNEQFNATLPVRQSGRNSSQKNDCQEANGGARTGTQSSGGPNTPDLLYSMDSLNVCGNNSSSITSAELPPSSISPQRDPWNASSFSDESLHNQGRNLSRLHKDTHQRTTDDEGLSSSTYESDSLNPDATLSGMHPHHEVTRSPFEHDHQNTILRRGVSPPKTEVGMEATEELPLTKTSKSSSSQNLMSKSTSSNDITILSPSSSSPNLTDHSITINGRKVSGGEETPLPIIVGLTQSDADLSNGSCVSSKIGITSSEINTPPPLPLVPPPSTSASSGNGIYSMGTIKRGSRMKSPPPPPPPSKQANGGGGITFHAGGDADTESCDKKMTSLNSLMRRKVDFGNNNSRHKFNGSEINDDNENLTPMVFESDKVNVMKTPSSQQQQQQQQAAASPSSSGNEHAHALETEETLSSDSQCKNGNKKTKCENSSETVGAEKQQSCSKKRDDDGGMKEKDKVEANPTHLNPTNSAKEIKRVDDNTEILIRPCKGSKQSIDEGVVTFNQIQHATTTNYFVKDGVACENDSKEEEEKLLKNTHKETVNEQNSLNHDIVDTNKTELDCKDGKDDDAHHHHHVTNNATNNATTTTTCNNTDEIKPVSCSPNVKEEIELLNKNGEECLILLSSTITTTNYDTDKKLIDGDKENGENINVDDIVGDAGVDFPEMCDKQFETVPMFDVTSNVLAVSMLDKKVHDVGGSSGGIHSKFGTEEKQQRNNGWGEFLSRENTPLRQEQRTSSSSPTAGAGDGDVLLRGGNKSGKSSNSSSRRGSLSASSVDLNSVGVAQRQNSPSNGILNCNRISLCSLPDNEIDVDNFESPPPPILDSETIRDQPLGCQTNYEMLNSSSGDEDLKQSKTVKAENETTEKAGRITGYFNGSVKVGGKNHHQRKLSMSKIDFYSSKNQDESKPVASSAPAPSVITSLFEKNVVSRKGSFPELYVNTANVRSLRRKLSVGNEIHSNKEISSGSSFKSPFVSDENGDTKGASEPNVSSLKSQAAKNDFLQTLGEIYACKSKLLTNKLQSSTPHISFSSLNETSSLKEVAAIEDTSTELVSIGKTKSGDPSMETVDGFDCQDRSISEYNISPRSARELVTESLINASTSISSTVSQKSIVTINESDVMTVAAKGAPALAAVPFSAGVGAETKNPFGYNTNDPADVPVVVVPQQSQPNSISSNNSATYKKKPSFIRGRVSKGNSTTSSMEVFEVPSSSKKTAQDADKKTSFEANGEKKQPNMPIPPPMPCLQYSRTNSYSSTASSSMGDSVDSHQENRKSPCFEDKNKTYDKRRSRPSPDKIVPKINGSISSECSLIEVNLANQKSTSDAIIKELKKAQARKLKFSGGKSAESLSDAQDDRKEPKQSLEHQSKTIAIVDVYGQSDKRVQDLYKNSIDETLCGSVPKYQQAINHDKHVIEDPPVKAIVNGKHTNNIIVNEIPIATAKKESLEKTRGGVNTTNPSISQKRGNIMSPSLSGNYTEMNGIDSETMGASSIHEDELSGQLQQKENHINELHGNVDEVQTVNKLDGASFRRVLSEYEKTLSMFIQQIDQLKQRMDEAETEKQTLIKERDQALEDLRNVESAFSDVHRKYERAKALLENMKSNEDTLIRRDQEMMQRIQNRDKKIDLIKEKAQESIEKMHLDYETRIKEMEFENAKLRAQYRKMEMKLSTLENDVEQKAKENAQLSALCDELINGQVGQV